RCCRRLESVTRDRTLWEIVDFRPDVLSLFHLKRYIHFLQPATRLIATRGPATSAATKHHHPSICKSFLRGVARNAPNLTILILENHIIDSSKLTLEDFPRSLQELRLQKCVMTHVFPDRSYFHRMNKSLPKLKILDLTDCDWFMPHSLLALSKSQSLEELVLTGCDVCDCLPYTSLAANFGFSALRVLDLRFTLVSDTEVSCFNRTTTLRELMLDAPGDTSRDFSITSYGGGGGGRVGGAQRLWAGGGPGQPHWNFQNEGVVIIEVGAYPRPVCRLESLVIRGYPGVTDTTLTHVADHMTYIRYLDVTGSGVTQQGIAQFKKKRPQVTIVPDIHAELS
ncbi:hypothetical protein AAG570_004357, partial [Ranatra chinensis]